MTLQYIGTKYQNIYVVQNILANEDLFRKGETIAAAAAIACE